MIQLELRGYEKLLEGNERFQRAIVGTMRRSLGRSLRAVVEGTRREYLTVPMLRHITESKWGKKRLNALGARIKVTRAGGEIVGAGGATSQSFMAQGASGAQFTGAIGLYGYAGVFEEGGRIVPHSIVMGARLSSPSRKGIRRRIKGTGRTVRHPGAVVPGHGFGGSNLRHNETAILAELDRDIEALLRDTYGF